MKIKISALDLCLAIMVTISWGFNFVFSKIALEIMPVYSLLFLRFLVMSLIFLPFYPRPPVKIKKIFIIAIVFSVCHLGTMYSALRLGLNSSIAVFVEQLTIPFLLIMGVFIFKEKINAKLMIGVLCAFLGTFILLGTPNSLGNMFAFLLIVISAFFWALYSILLKKVGNVSPMAITTWISVISVFISLTMVLLFEDVTIYNWGFISNASILHLFSIFFVCFAPSILGHAIWYYLLVRNPVESVAPILLLVPVFGVIGAVIFTSEELSLGLFLGGMLVIIGVAIDLVTPEKLAVQDKKCAKQS